MLSPLEVAPIWQKLQVLETSAHLLLSQPRNFVVPALPGRDTAILLPGNLPKKKGLSYIEGQARLLHDLASIELQAMELCVRSLIEYPDAHPDFRQELLHLALSEGGHLRLCLQALEKLGYHWGVWPAHLALWQSVSVKDSLLDRILIVHCYLEGSGLDAGETILRRLHGMGEGLVAKTVKTIVNEEIAHVQLGVKWYKQVCRSLRLNEQDDFSERMTKLALTLPKRIEPISVELRQKAGFEPWQIEYFQNLRNSVIKNQTMKRYKELP
jgi:uncharacterized ferritin-like protein (DUF455 family)